MFDEALTNQIEEFKTVVQSKELREMTSLIDETNRKL